MSSPAKSLSPPLPSPRGYSDFFASGLRAVTNRARRTSFNRRSIDVVQTSSSYWTDRRPEAHNTFTRRRHASLGEPHDLLDDKTKKRRSALISLSARLFDRAPSSAEESSTASTASSHSSRSSKQSSSYLVVENAEEGVDIIISEARSNFDRKTSASLRPLEPRSAPPDVGSHTITFPPNLLSSATRESFLSLNSSRSSRASLLLPPLPEHPGSIHSISAGDHSRRSSVDLLPTPGPGQSEFTWTSDEGPKSDQINPSRLETGDKGHWDAPANLDWRQFHTDILSDAE